jgi:hypothetical protein
VSWWRRNRWGLIGLGPAVAAVLVLSAQPSEVVRDARPHDPVPLAADGWYHLANARLRLSTLEHARGLLDAAGRPFVAPTHVVIWRATLDIQAGNGAAIAACDVSLEDSRGRLYSTQPGLELAGSSGAASRGCVSLDDADTSWTDPEFFALPEDAQPAAVRVTVPGFEPAYVRLPSR